MPFFRRDPSLQELGDRLLEKIWSEFPKLARNQIALTWILYDDPVPVNTGGAIAPEDFWQIPVRGFSYRGVECIYPASVVKLFYLVAIHAWLENAMVPQSAELDRAIADMIVDSSNDATGLMVDTLTGTTSGPELPPGPFKSWQHQRNLVNRYFQTFGWEELDTINVNQKTWGDGPYGREKAFLGPMMENRNRLTTEAAARLLHSIVGGVAVSPQRSEQMMELMFRSLDPVLQAQDPENQVTGFLGGGLPEAAQVWSKAGFTSRVRHDAAYVEVPGLPPFMLVAFTEGHSRNEAILPFVAGQVVELTAA
ncbi:MAG: serine hydrolase [Cyanobacteria bacterium P01_A01_bin.135]